MNATPKSDSTIPLQEGISLRLIRVKRLLDQYQYLDALVLLNEIDAKALSEYFKEYYYIYKSMAISNVGSVESQLLHFKQAVKLYPNDVYQFYYWVLRLRVMANRFSGGQVKRAYDYVEKHVNNLSNDSYRALFALENASYFNDQNEYIECLNTLSWYEPEDTPCPLFYFSIKVKALIGLGYEEGIDRLLSSVERLVAGLQLGTDKLELHYEILLRVALHRAIESEILLYAKLLSEVLLVMQQSFSENHRLVLRSMRTYGVSQRKLRQLELKFQGKPTNTNKPHKLNQFKTERRNQIFVPELV